MPRPSLDEIFNNTATVDNRPSLDSIFQQSKPALKFKTPEEANIAQKEAQKNLNLAKFNASPLGIIPQAMKGAEATVRGSAFNTIKNITDTLIHPVRTVGALGGTAVGLAEKLIPGEQPQERYPNAIGTMIK